MSAEAGRERELLAGYSALVRQYHGTLDLVSPAGLERWDELLADALLYGEVIAELAPDAEAVLDIGSGAGLPGIPLAVSRPDLAFLLVERRRRRSAFLQLAAGQLGLDNVEVAQTDVRKVNGRRFSAITAQAVGTFASVHELSRHLHGPEVVLVSSKGAAWEDEAEQLAAVPGVRLVASARRPKPDGDGAVVGLLLREDI